jgi:AraC family transcriptional regulator
MSDTKTWFLKNMLCSCCKVLLKERLEAVGLEVLAVELGEVNFVVNEQIPEEKIIETISSLGYEIIEGRDSVLVEKIKLAVIDLVHHLNNMNSIIRKSDYLVEKLGMSYQQLSKTFSQHEPITLEKYIILHKIEKIKELVDSGEYTLSEIAYMMDNSSVQHLSAQFKQHEGLTPSEYKRSDKSMRTPLEELGRG